MNKLEKNDAKPIIAVTMSTGRQGRSVVNELSKTNKFTIRAITRNTSSDNALKLKQLPNVELFQADLLNKESLEKSFEGVYGIFGNTTPTKGWQPLVREYEIEQGRNLINLVKKSKEKGKLKHFIFSSVCKAKDPLMNEPAPSHFSSKWDIEDYIFLNDLKEITTIIRPVSYFENFNGNLPGLKITANSFPGVVKADKIWQTIAVDDIGKWCSAIFTKRNKFIGKSINIAGEELTGNQMAALLQKLRGSKSRDIKYSMVPRFLMKLFVHDIGIMADWIERTGYGADINEVKSIAKEENIDITSLSKWLINKNII